MIRRLDVMAKQAEAVDVAPFVRLLTSPIVAGTNARELRGTIFVAFPECEVDDVRLWYDPRVRTFLRALHDAIPCLFYFLCPAVEFGAVQGFIWSFMDEAEYNSAHNESTFEFTEHLAQHLLEHFVAAARYATENGDDWRVVINAQISALPTESRAALLCGIEEGL